MDDPTPENRTELITHLQLLWQSDPGSYRPALRQSGLTAQDVWPQQARMSAGVEMPRSEKLTTPSKRKGVQKEEAGSA